jgi:hypothetical protein
MRQKIIAAIPMTILIVCLTALAIVGWRHQASPPPQPMPHPRPMAAQPATGTPSPVYLSDKTDITGHLIGDVNNPMYVTGTAGGGTSGVDTTAGDLLSTTTHFVAGTTAGAFATDSGAGTFVGANYVNVGGIPGYFQVFCGQTATDAGGTAVALTTPSLLTPYLMPGQSGSLTEPQTCYDGGVWYSSSTQAFLTQDAGVPNLSVDVVHR